MPKMTPEKISKCHAIRIPHAFCDLVYVPIGRFQEMDRVFHSQLLKIRER